MQFNALKFHIFENKTLNKIKLNRVATSDALKNNFDYFSILYLNHFSFLIHSTIVLYHLNNIMDGSYEISQLH